MLVSVKICVEVFMATCYFPDKLHKYFHHFIPEHFGKLSITAYFFQNLFGWCYKIPLCQCFYAHKLQPDVWDRCHHKLAFRTRCSFHPGWKKQLMQTNPALSILKAPSNVITSSDKSGQDRLIIKMRHRHLNTTYWRRCTLYFLKSSLCYTPGQTDKELKGSPR